LQSIETSSDLGQNLLLETEQGSLLFGTYWQVATSGDNLSKIAKADAKSLHGNAYVLSEDINQYGLTYIDEDVRLPKKMYCAGVCLVEELGISTEHSLMVSVELTEDRWWFLCYKQGAFEADGDVVVNSEEEAKSLFDQYRAIVQPTYVLAPEHWQIPNSDELDISKMGISQNAIVKTIGSGFLAQLSEGKNKNLILLTGAVAVLMAGFSVWWVWNDIQSVEQAKLDELVRIKKEKDRRAKQEALAQSSEKVKLATSNKPWFKQPTPNKYIAGCLQSAENVAVHVRGWEFQQSLCSQGIVSAMYRYEFGSLMEIVSVANANDLLSSWDNQGVLVTLESELDIPPARKPEEGLMSYDIARVHLFDYVRTIPGSLITFTQHEKQEADDRNGYSLVSFKLKTETSPEIFFDMFADSRGIVINRLVLLQDSTWEMEGKLYVLPL